MNSSVTMHEFTVEQEQAKGIEVGDDIQLCTTLTDVAEDSDKKYSSFKTFKVIELKLERKEGGIIIGTIKVANKEEYEKWCTQE